MIKEKINIKKTMNNNDIHAISELIWERLKVNEWK